jgi:membrane protease YdiL (CAAX protease family)
MRNATDAALVSPDPLSGWATSGWGLLALSAWLATEAAVLLTYLVGFVVLNPGAPIDVDKISHDGFLLSLATIIALAVQTAVVARALSRRHRPVASYLCLDRRPRTREVLLSLLGLALILAASDLLSRAIGLPLIPRFMVKIYQGARDPSTIVLLLIAALVIAPIGEEILFRGFLFRGWAASKLGVVGTILLTSALWASIHLQYDWLGIAQVFCLGLLFGVARWRSGSTALTMLMHSACNLIATIETAVIIR